MSKAIEIETMKTTPVNITGVASRLEIVSPKKAERMLAARGKQRGLRMHHAKNLAAAMDRGEWIGGASVITFDTGGHLIDGQHRLMAVILHGKPITFRVDYGVDPAFMYAIDTNVLGRSLRDLLAINDEKNYSHLATAIRLVYKYEKDNEMRGGVVQLNRPSSLVYLNFLNEHIPTIRDSVRKMVGMTKQFTGVYSVGHAAGFHYLFSIDDPDAADRFFKDLANGEGITRSDPVFRLRARMLENNRKHRQYGPKLPDRMVWALTIKAWNATVSGEVLRTLRWSAGSEKFPAILRISEGVN